MFLLTLDTSRDMLLVHSFYFVPTVNTSIDRKSLRAVETVQQIFINIHHLLTKLEIHCNWNGFCNTVYNRYKFIEAKISICTLEFDSGGESLPLFHSSLPPLHLNIMAQCRDSPNDRIRWNNSGKTPLFFVSKPRSFSCKNLTM